MYQRVSQLLLRDTSPYIRLEVGKERTAQVMGKQKQRQTRDVDRASERLLTAEAGIGLKISGFLLCSLPDIHDQLKKHLL